MIDPIVDAELSAIKTGFSQQLESLLRIVKLQALEIRTKDTFINFLLREMPDRYFCPVCNSHLKFLRPLPEEYRDQAARYGYIHFGKGEMTALNTYSCPQCGASDRERLYAHWIKRQLGIDIHITSRIIHFAPEHALSQWMRLMGFQDYRTADLAMPGVDHRVDITKLPFPNHHVDFFICSHVLEHVASDDDAVSELFRILRPEGVGILMAPIVVGLEHTIEDPTIVDEKERWRLFGQGDHVRLYSHDGFVSKLKGHGFVVYELGIGDFGEDNFNAMGLKCSSVLYIVRKPAGPYLDG